MGMWPLPADGGWVFFTDAAGAGIVGSGCGDGYLPAGREQAPVGGVWGLAEGGWAALFHE